MTRSDLVRALAERQALPRRVSRRVVDTVLDGIVEALCAGDRVELRGFGCWRVRHYPAYTGRNPRSGERVFVEPKVLPVFKAGRALLERLDDSNQMED